MKKLFYGLVVVAGLAVPAFAGWFTQHKQITYNVTGAFTNQAVNPQRVSAITYRYEAAATGTVTFSIARDGVTNAVLSDTLSGVTVGFYSRSEFDGLWLEQDDIFVITDDTGAYLTNAITLTLEEERR